MISAILYVDSPKLCVDFELLKLSFVNLDTNTMFELHSNASACLLLSQQLKLSSTAGHI